MPHDLLIISDIHLTDGRAPIAGEVHLVPELVRFLRAHRDHPERGRHWRLVFNGDLFDFLHVQLKDDEEVPFELTPGELARGPGTTPEKSLWKLRKILGANGPFLRSLGDFLRAGNEVVILPGNHDLELYWEPIRRELREWLAPHATSEGIDRLDFKPWCYHEPGLIYVEHGSQYDADNRVFRWMAPEVPDRPGALELSAGSIVNRYFTHRLGLGPFVGDTSQSALGYAIWMMRQFGFWRYFALFGWYLAFCWKVVGWAGRRSPKVDEANRLHQERRSQVEANEGMPAGAMASIEEAAPPAVMSTRWKMLNRTMLPRVVIGCGAVAGALATLLVGGWSVANAFIALGVLFVPIGILTLNRGTYTGVADRYYPRAAETVRRVLGVRHVAFGHQHVAKSETDAEGERRYFNLGCWIEGEGFEVVPLHYLEIRRGAAPSATLKQWGVQSPDEKAAAPRAAA